MKLARLALLTLLLAVPAIGSAQEVGSYPNANALTGTERILADQASSFPCTGCSVNLTPAQISTYLLTSGNLFPTYSTGALTWNGTALAWSAVGSGNVTTSGSPAQYQIPVWVTGTAVGGITPPSTVGVPLIGQGTGSYPIFGALNLAGGSSIVTGTLPIANGGTGAATAALAMAGLLPTYVASNCLTNNGSVLSWAACGNPAGATYTLQYNNAGVFGAIAAPSANNQVLQGSPGSAPAWVTPVTFPNFTAYTSAANGDLLMISPVTGSYPTDQITVGQLFANIPGIVGLNPGATSAASWTTNGLALFGTAATLTDTTGTGTVAIEAATALPPFTIAGSGAFTITNLAELYLPIPVAGTNVTATNKWSLYLAGGEYIVGSFQVQSQITDNGPFVINTGNISHSSWTTNGLLIEQETGTLTDTTATGTVATEAMIAFAGDTLAASNSGVTVTNLDQVLIGAPSAGTNVTATNKWSLHTLGSILNAGFMALANGILDNGTTFTLGTGTGACATSSTLTGGSVTGSFKCTGTAGSSTQIINMPSGVAKNGWHCSASDATSGVAWANEVDSTSAAKIAGTITTTSDVVTFHCDAY